MICMRLEKKINLKDNVEQFVMEVKEAITDAPLSIRMIADAVPPVIDMDDKIIFALSTADKTATLLEFAGKIELPARVD